MSLRHTLVNIICGFVPGKKTRSRVRIFLMYPAAFSYVRYVKRWARENCGGVQNMYLDFGVGCHNLVVLLNKQHVFKFSLVDNRPSRAPREKRIVDALRNVSPIHLPEVELIDWDGTIVRHYEFIRGKLISEFEPWYINQHKEKIAKQLAEFMFAVGRADPDEIRDLKPNQDAKPGYLYGWFHNDLGNNFIMDDDLNVVAIIDNEKTEFCNFRNGLSMTSHFWDKLDVLGLMVATLVEYSKLYYSDR